MRILLVDDEPLRMKPWEVMLRSAPHTVEFATSIADALGRLGDATLPVPDLVLVDLMMPTSAGLTDRETEWGTRTGIPVLRRLRAEHPDLHLAMLTNLDDPVALEVARAFSVPYLNKGVYTPRKLLDWLSAQGYQPDKSSTT